MSDIKHVWLDCDPGHDDALAILLAVHTPNIKLLGISTVYGNTNSEYTAQNAARCLHVFDASPEIKVYPGAKRPLLRQPKRDPETRREDGLGGVEGLPDRDSPFVRARFVADGRGGHVRGLDGMATNIKNAIDAGKKVTVLSTGPETNVALFISVYPDLLHGIEQFVFMGGGVGLGNVSAVAEFNVLCDPEAAQILLNAPVKKVMVPMNVTHTAIMKEHLHAELMSSDTPLRRMISSLITFFADIYKSKFGFMEGCPLHDPLVVCWVSHPELYQSKRYRVDVELSASHTYGETVVDVWNYRQCDDSWGPSGKNCIVAESLDVDKFFKILFDCVARCEKAASVVE